MNQKDLIAAVRNHSLWNDAPAPPGWLPRAEYMHQLSSNTRSQRHAKKWTFESHNASASLHTIGETEYRIPLQPFDSTQGDLYSVEMRFRAKHTFEGWLREMRHGGMGGGASGLFTGIAVFHYTDPDSSWQFYGDGEGEGDGGAPGGHRSTHSSTCMYQLVLQFGMRGPSVLTACGRSCAALTNSSFCACVCEQVAMWSGNTGSMHDGASWLTQRPPTQASAPNPTSLPIVAAQMPARQVW